MQRRRRSGVLLAGGASTRFGGAPKGLAPFGGARLADRALAALHATCDEVLVAANDPDAAAWFPGLRIAADELSIPGALAGLVTAISAARHPIVIVCAWDMPFVTPAVLGALAMTVDLGSACCVPVHADGAVEPLCAAYDRRLCHPQALQALLFSDNGAARDVLIRTDGTRWSIEDNLRPEEAAVIFSNVNTPDDLRAAQHWLMMSGE